MKLKTIIATKPALERLTEKRFSDYKKLREIVRLRKSVEAEFDSYLPFNYSTVKSALESEYSRRSALRQGVSLSAIGYLW